MKMHDCLLGLLIMVSGIAICSVALTFPNQNDGKPGPWLFPTVLSVFFSVCGLVLFIKGLLHFKEQRLFENTSGLSAAGLFNIAVVIVLVIAYILLSDSLGFLITMTAIMLILMLLLKFGVVKSLIAAPLAVLFIYMIFAKLLLVPLPEGIFYF